MRSTAYHVENAAIQSFNIWKSTVKPHSGLDFADKRRAKLKYKLSIREKERYNANSFYDSLNDAFNTKDMDSFWRTFKFSNKRMSSIIDGHCNDSDIANTFAAEVFKGVCVPSAADKPERLYSLFSERFKYYNCNNAPSDFISVDFAQNVVNLKRGKVAGFECLMAEHICLALLHILFHWFICHVCSQCCINIIRCLMILAEKSIYIYLRIWSVTGSQQ